MHWTALSSRHNLGYPAWAFSLLLLCLPAATLGLLAQRTGSPQIAVGAGVLTLFTLIFLRATRSGDRPSAYRS